MAEPGRNIMGEVAERNQATTQLLQELEKYKFDLTQKQTELQDIEQQISNLTQCYGPSPERDQRLSELQIQQSATINGYTQIDQQIRQIISQTISAFESCVATVRVALNELKRSLESWKITQRIAQIGPRIDVLLCYQQLKGFDERFGELETEQENLYNAIDGLQNSLQTFDDQQTLMKIQQIKDETLQLMFDQAYESIVVARQPPIFLMPGRQGKSDSNTRGMRHPCIPVIRAIGKTNFGLRMSSAPVTCIILTEEEAFRVQNKAQQGREHKPAKAGNLHPNETQFKVQESGSFQAVYDKKIHLFGFDDKEKKTNVPRPWKRYYIVFDVQLTGKYFGLKKKVVSLPFSVYSNVIQRFEQGGDAALWWQLAFCQGSGVLGPDAPKQVKAETFIFALEKKLQQLIEEPDGPSDPNKSPKNAAHPFQDVARKHLIAKLDNSQTGNVRWEMFWQNGVPLPKSPCKKYNEKTKMEEPTSFREWFYSCALTINKHLQTYWNAGLITGFCDKDKAWQLVSQNRDAGKMMVRFSDSKIGYVMITYYLPPASQMLLQTHRRSPHMTLKASELENPKMSLTKLVKNDENLRLIDKIYPDKQKSDLEKDDENASSGIKFDYEVDLIEQAPVCVSPNNPTSPPPAACATPSDMGDGMWMEEIDENYDFDPSDVANLLMSAQVMNNEETTMQNNFDSFGMHQSVQFN